MPRRRRPTAPMMPLIEQLDALAAAYGNRFLLEPAPDNALPKHGMRSVDAMRLIGEELVLDGIPMRNLATFVTTWMEPEAQRVIAENLHRNYIDHAEYPQTAEIEQRCIRMLADLFHAPGETTGTRTQGSSEAIMLGALSLKWKWRARREAAGKDTTGRTSCSAATCTWCGRSSAATSTSSRGSSRCSPTSSRSARRTSSRTSTRTRSASPPCSGTTFTGHADDIVGIDALLVRPARRARARRPAARRRRQRRLRVAVPVPRLGVGLPARAGALDQRLGPQVRARLPGPRLADLPRAERPRRGPRLLRELPRQARRDVHAELLDRLEHGARAVLQLRPLRARGLPLHHGDDAGQRARRWPSGSSTSASSSWSATRAPSSSRWSPSSSPRSATSTSSTSPRSSPPSAAGWCPPTRCRPTPST